MSLLATVHRWAFWEGVLFMENTFVDMMAASFKCCADLIHNAIVLWDLFQTGLLYSKPLDSYQVSMKCRGKTTGW